MSPYSLVKKCLKNFGVYVFRAGNLPRQIDFCADLKKLGLTPQVVFDVGANVGQFARGAASAFPGATIHSFEPVSSTFSKLDDLARQQPCIHPYHLAFGEKPGEFTMHLREESGCNSLSPHNNLAANSIGRSETITVTTIDAFCSAKNIPRIDLLKTDTEGFDNSVLLGARRMLQESRVGVIFSEVTFLEFDRTHTQFFQLCDTLRPFGFAVYGAYQPEGDGDTMYCNVLFVQKSHLLQPR
jgi:FkbM family methyltransferase